MVVPAKLDEAEGRVLAGALGDTPETVAAVHGLTYGFYDAWTIGSPSTFKAAVVQSRIWTAMAIGFGRNPVALAHLLLHIQGWRWALLDAGCARRVGDLITRATGQELTHEDDINYLPRGEIARFHNPGVRLLNRDDLGALEWIMGWGFTRERLEHILINGVIACAVVDGRTVSAAYTDSWTEKFAEITAGTDRDWLNRGSATAAASLVCRRVVEQGRTPVWTTNAENVGSRRIAEKLSFTEVSRRVCVTRPGQER